MKEKRLYIIAIVGAVICFIGDYLLGGYLPASDFGNKLLCIRFSYEWANVSPNRFVIAGFCGVIALLMMFAGFYGVYIRLVEHQSTLAKPFLFCAFVFVGVGTMYHNVFAITAYLYNKLSTAGFSDAKQLSLEVFNTFIIVGALAAAGYLGSVLILFLEALKGKLYPKKWMCVINPLIFMLISIGLTMILPKTAFVNGVFDMGQQSVGLLIVFVVLYFTSEKKRGR